MQTRPSWLLSSLTAALLSASLPGCSAPSKNDCNDGIDNDGDGTFDADDPGCQLNGESEWPDPVDATPPPRPACSDGLDNDNDGLYDYPSDQGCTGPDDEDEYDTPPPPTCLDEMDNDGDTLVDFPEDPGCTSAADSDETDDCPTGPNCPACSDGQDNDGDMVADYPDDPGCLSASDDQEAEPVSGVCGGVVAYALPESGIFEGEHTTGFNSVIQSPNCDGLGSEIALVISIDEPKAMIATTNNDGSDLDTVLYLRSACTDENSELACDDDDEEIGSSQSTLQVNRLEPGDYYLIVDTFSLASSGRYRVEVTFQIPEGGSCDPASDPTECPDGLVCRPELPTSTEPTCVPPQCSDGHDNDGDGLSDFPNEPGCTDEADNDEADGCSDGGDCPACGNGIDDDDDTFTDYPNDPGCTSAADTNEIDECLPGLPVLALVAGTPATGTTTGDGSLQGGCGSSGTSGEAVHAFPVTRELVDLTFSTAGSTYDTITYVRFDQCGQTSAEVACQNNSSETETITLDAPELGNYYVIVDGSYGATGNYTLTVTGTIPGGDDCIAGDTAFVCESGYLCNADTSSCEPTICNNGEDDDGDTLIDAFDPGCSSADDDTEDPNPDPLPECADGVDNDGDTLTDYDSDPGCTAASDNNEIDECVPGMPVQSLSPGVPATGATDGNGEMDGSCGSASTADEEVFAYRLARTMKSLSFSTAGSDYDTITYVRLNDCGDSTKEVGCENTSSNTETVTLDDPALGTYFVFVDGSYGDTGNYSLTLTGVIPGGEACDVADTAFVCEVGFVCDGDTSACVETQCNNGTDDDGDTLVDDFDPGCASIADNEESPDPDPLPECADGIDNDGDTFTDYDSDPGCMSASDNLELDECLPGLPVMGQIVPGVAVTGTTEGSGELTSDCSSSGTAGEEVYSYRLQRSMASLTFSTVGSSYDTVTHVRLGDCADAAAEVGCAQTVSGGDVVTIRNPEQGFYFAIVDGYYSAVGNYTMTLTGTIAGGDACDVADTAFVCDAGFVCDGDTSTCVATQCNNGTDDDGDTLIDAFDPGCESVLDNEETPDPTPLPACADGMDNDGDTLVDYNEDLGCSRASDDSELDCEDTDPLVEVTSSTISGTTSGTSNSLSPSCQSTSTAPELVHRLIIPGQLDSLTIDTFTSSFDTVLYLRRGECTAADVACDDDSGATQSKVSTEDTGDSGALIPSPVMPGTLFIVVDGYSGNAGLYNLNISGVISVAAPCNPDQISAGMFTCAAGTTCTDSGTGPRCQ